MNEWLDEFHGQFINDILTNLYSFSVEYLMTAMICFSMFCLFIFFFYFVLFLLLLFCDVSFYLLHFCSVVIINWMAFNNDDVNRSHQINFPYTVNSQKHKQIFTKDILMFSILFTFPIGFFIFSIINHVNISIPSILFL